MPKLTAAVRSERRQQLIDAAWRCTARSGFASLTVDDVCAEAAVSKGAFYGYFAQKEDLLLALLEDDATSLDSIMSQLSRTSLSGAERLRKFARAMLEHGEDPARLQVRADLWAGMSTQRAVQDRLAATVGHRRQTLRSWIEEGVAAGELAEVPANALAAILLALGDGLMLHAGLDPSGFRWPNIRRALDALLAGIAR